MWWRVRLWLARAARRLWKRVTVAAANGRVRLDALRHDGRDRRRVLLMAQSELMAGHVRDVHALLAEDERLSFAVATWKQPIPPEVFAGLPRWTLSQAKRRWWDLVISADQMMPDRLPRAIRVAMINHSIAGSKIVEGRFYRFDPGYLLYDNGRPRYAAIFEAGQDGLAKGIECCPAAVDMIRVVGDLRSDRLHERMGRREAVRERLGIGAGETAVLLMSTWGPDSLFERMREPLLEKASKMMQSGGFRFMLSLHPYIWRDAENTGRPIAEVLRPYVDAGLTLVQPDSEQVDHLVAADLAISDHTGLSVSYAITGKPIIYVEGTRDRVHEASAIARFSRLFPELAEDTELEAMVRGALDTYPSDDAKVLAECIWAHRGEAAERLQEELYELLHLPMPVAASPKRASMSSDQHGHETHRAA